MRVKYPRRHLAKSWFEQLEDRQLLAGDPLNIAAQLNYPKIRLDTAPASVSYNKVTQILDLKAALLEIDLSPSDIDFPAGTLEIQIQVDSANGAVIGGVAGVDDFILRDGSTIYLTGEVRPLGFGYENLAPEIPPNSPPTNSVTEFIFQPTGGIYASYFDASHAVAPDTGPLDIGVRTVLNNVVLNFVNSFSFTDPLLVLKGNIGSIPGPPGGGDTPSPSKISGTKFLDLTGNGISADDPVWTTGVTIDLFKDQNNNGVLDAGDGSRVDTTVTAANGTYSFTIASANSGIYFVQEQIPATYAQTAPTSGYYKVDLTLSGTVVEHQDFANKRLPGVIKGTKYLDVTGNGLTYSDDTKLGGVTINLYRDSNGTPGFQQTGVNPDALAGTTTTDSAGAYGFNVITPGNYFVTEVVPDGYVRTAPALATYYSAQVYYGQIVSGLDFANAEKCDPASLCNIFYYVNGCKVTDLRGNVHQGDYVEVVFTVRQGYRETYSLVSYEAPGAVFDANNAGLQKIYQVATTGEVGPGTYTLAVRVPDCYFQVDFVCGDAIDHFGPAGSNIFYSAQSRLHSADNGGTVACRPDEASVSGFVYVDADNDGIKDLGETPLSGIKVTLKNSSGGSILSRTTASDGSYYFGNLAPGSYYVVETQPANYADGKDTIGSQGGISNANDSLKFTLVANQNGVNNNFGEQLCPTSSLSGFVFVDCNNDGDVDPTDTGIEGVTITLRGTDGNGATVFRTMQTDEDGFYKFDDLLPGTYSITETQPSGYTDGKDSIGTQGGNTSNDLFSNVRIGANVDGINNNFAELKSTKLICGDTATIGFWNNRNGQNLIKSLNGGSTAKELGNWLAETFPNIWGNGSGTANNLAGKTNAQVAAYFQTQFCVTGMKLNAQVMAVALAVYSTNSNLAGTVAGSYGFNVSLTGTGARVINVGVNGAAFGVANYTSMTVSDILTATDALSAGGSGSTQYDIYNGNTTRRNMANIIYDYINTTGDI